MLFKWRELDARDEMDVVREFNDPMVNRWLAWPSGRFSSANFALLLGEVRNKRTAGRLVESVALNEAGALVGAASLARQTAEIGFWVARRYWRQGIGTRLVSEFIENQIRPLRMNHIIAAIHTENIPSIRLVEKCRFECIALVPYCFASPSADDRAFLYRLALPN